MLSILSNSFLTASRQTRWDAPDHWAHDGRPLKTHEVEYKEAKFRAPAQRSNKS